MNDMENEFLNLSGDIEILINESNKELEVIKDSSGLEQIILLIPFVFFIIFNPFSLTIMSILGGLFSIGLGIFAANDISKYVKEFIKNKQLKKLNSYVLEFEQDIDNCYYESYVLTDYFKDKDYSINKIKQMNEYLSCFNRNEPNSCRNEVGMEYNYRPYHMIEENKNLESLNVNKNDISNLNLKPVGFELDEKVVYKNNNEVEIKNIEEKLLILYSNINDLLIESDSKITGISTSGASSFMCLAITIFVCMLQSTVNVHNIIKLIMIISSGVFSIIGTTSYILESKKNKELRKLNDNILEIEDDIDNRFFESYVLTDYFKDNDYSLKKIKQINEYLSKFDKNKPNSCFNEVGMKYNYSPVSEDKTLQIEAKEKDKIGNFKEFKVITDTRLEDKYLEQPLFLEDKQSVFGSSINNLELKPSVFDSGKKKINKENNSYTHIEISIGKVKVLTIDKRK